MLWIYANEMALVAALNLYGIKSRIIPLSAAGATPERTTSKRTTLLSAMQAYLISIYGFALAFRFAQIYEGKSFIDPINNMTTATYFSIVTIATVGYGDITPKTDLARILVSLEILFGVAYSVFFFSIIAGFIREFPSTTVTDKTP